MDYTFQIVVTAPTHKGGELMFKVGDIIGFKKSSDVATLNGSNYEYNESFAKNRLGFLHVRDLPQEDIKALIHLDSPQLGNGGTTVTTQRNHFFDNVLLDQSTIDDLAASGEATITWTQTKSSLTNRATGALIQDEDV